MAYPRGGLYQTYWDKLKKEKKIAIKVYPKSVKTLKRMISKKKNEDLSYRLLESEAGRNWEIFPSYQALPEEGKVLVTFNLKLILKGTTL